MQDTARAQCCHSATQAHHLFTRLDQRQALHSSRHPRLVPRALHGGSLFRLYVDLLRQQPLTWRVRWIDTTAALLVRGNWSRLLKTLRVHVVELNCRTASGRSTRPMRRWPLLTVRDTMNPRQRRRAHINLRDCILTHNAETLHKHSLCPNTSHLVRATTTTTTKLPTRCHDFGILIQYPPSSQLMNLTRTR